MMHPRAQQEIERNFIKAKLWSEKDAHGIYIMQEMLTRNSTDIRETYIKVQSITLQGTIMKPKTE